YSTLSDVVLSAFFSLLSLIRRPSITPRFPYTTLFRSDYGGIKEKTTVDVEVAFSSWDEDGKKLEKDGTLRLIVVPGSDSERPLRSEEHTSELQSRFDLVCRLLLEKKTVTRHPRQNRTA